MQRLVEPVYDQCNRIESKVHTPAFTTLAPIRVVAVRLPIVDSKASIRS